MATPKWQPAKLYAPGSLVVPRTNVPAGTIGAILNPGFETGTTADWTVDGGMSISDSYSHSGEYSLRCDGIGTGEMRGIATAVAATPGMRVRGTCYYKQGNADAGQNVGYCILQWYDAGMGLIREDRGSAVSSGKDGAWHLSTVEQTGPAGAAFVAIGGLSIRTDDDHFSCFDDFAWQNKTTATEGLVYRAVQPATGRSAGVEPAWPPLGNQVIDNEVIWEAIVATRITWRARPILMSGPTEPVWRTDLGSSTVDNTISWVLDSRRVDDENCPNSKVVVLDQNKVYAADDDIIPFCAVNNPLDWTKPNDAGYLPFGNGRYGGTPVAAMGLYRGRLMAFNAEGMQDWQIDPDPALNQRLNSLPIGSTYHKSFAPFSNDAMLMTAMGVRTLGLAASTTNLAVGDAGTPVDPLIKQCLYRADKPGLEPKGLYIPSAGQYWAYFVGDEPNPGVDPGSYLDLPMVPWDDITLVYVYAVSEVGKVGAWQRYYFPFPIHHAVVATNEAGETVIAVRSGNQIIHIAERFLNDLMVSSAEDPHDFFHAEGGQRVRARIQWAWLEMGGLIGQDKTVEGVDLVGLSDAAFPPTIAMGWNQKDENAFTSPYTLPADTVVDEPVAFELTAPSISVRLEYNGGDWKFTALNVYLQDRRPAR